MSFSPRLGPALALAAMVSFTQAAPSRAEDTSAAAATEHSAVTVSAAWYEGGTLQRATARQWLDASTQNQLATASQWVLTSAQQKAKVAAAAGDMQSVLPSADKLRQCVNAALRRHSHLYSSMPVADIADTCMITLNL